MRTDLISLKIFLTVFNLRNIARAAERENIAPSAISKRLHELELECGTPLFYRHARGVMPTPAGESLARHAQDVLTGMNRMAAEMSTFASGENGEVRVHAHSSTVVQYLPHDIATFRKIYPGVKIQLREETSPTVIQSLNDGIADIGILASNVPIPNEFAQLPYRQDRLVAVLSATHPLARRASVSFAEVAEEGVISPESGSSLHLLLSQVSRTLGRNLKLTIEVRTLEAAVQMAGAGLGTAVVPAGLVKGQEKHGVIGVPLSDAWGTRQLVLCIKDTSLVSASARLMLNHLQKQASSLSKSPLPKRKPSASA
jgi:DNA-binding transcriptional LysR family regulator